MFLPAGPQSTAAPGNSYLYVTEARGNRLAAYRLGSDGLMPAAPFDTINLQNPRRIILVGDILYVATDDEVLSIRINADGSLPSVPTARSLPSNNADILDLLVVGDTLYAAFSGFRAIEVFRLSAGGHITDSPIGEGGEFSSDYQSIALFGEFLYAGARATARIDTFLVAGDGSISEEPLKQTPATFLSLPDKLLTRGGMLYSASKGRRRIVAYQIRADGLLPEEADSETARAGAYQDIILDGDTVYASAFNEGRIDTFFLNADGSLQDRGPEHSTKDDPTSFPAGMVLQGGVLYVAQAGAGRIDAYLTGASGFPDFFPTSSALALADSFPTDLVVYTRN